MKAACDGGLGALARPEGAVEPSGIRGWKVSGRCGVELF